MRVRIILSRKGFDSENGGYPSIVSPQGNLLSLPIPSATDKLCFSELTYENSNVLELMKRLGIKKFTSTSTCHLDPDICRDMIRRPPDWRGAFGQVGAAQKHLENNNIGVGDLFLFFGWFRKTKKNTYGQMEYVGPDFHLIYGFLQVGEIIRVHNNKNIPLWLSNHPHTNIEKYLEMKAGTNNTIYLASDELTFLRGVPGYGCFKFGPKLVLTKPGETRTHWALPQEFRGIQITYHTDENSKSGYFKSANRGQEFIFEEKTLIEKWGCKIIKAGLGI